MSFLQELEPLVRICPSAYLQCRGSRAQLTRPGTCPALSHHASQTSPLSQCRTTSRASHHASAHVEYRSQHAPHASHCHCATRPPTSSISRLCHDRDIPPQPSHICSCLLAVQTPPEHSLTKPEPIPGLPDPSIAFPNSSAAFPKGSCTDICLVSIPEAVNTIPEHI